MTSFTCGKFNFSHNTLFRDGFFSSFLALNPINDVTYIDLKHAVTHQKVDCGKMTAANDDGFYLEINYDPVVGQNDYGTILFTFSQVIGQFIENHTLDVSWNEVYLSLYDPTVLAVCVVYDQALWLTEGIKRITGVDRCTSNYRCSADEVVDVFDLPRLIRAVAPPL